MSQEKNVSKRSNIPKLSYFKNDLKKIDIQEVYRYRKKKIIYFATRPTRNSLLMSV